MTDLKLSSATDSLRSSTKVAPVAVARVRLRFEEWVGAVPAAILPPGWSTDFGSGPGWRLMPGDWAVIGTVHVSDMTLVRTSPRRADTLQISFSWGALPIDPRTIRAAGVELFVATLTPSERLSWIEAGGEPFEQTKSRLKFIGTGHEYDYDRDKNEVTIQCRDYTGLLLDAKMSQEAVAGTNLADTVDKVVQRIVDSHPSTIGMPVVWRPGLPPPTAEEAGLVAQRRIRTPSRSGLTAGSFRVKAKKTVERDAVAVAAGIAAQHSGAAQRVEFSPAKAKKAFVSVLVPIAREQAKATKATIRVRPSGRTKTVVYIPYKPDTRLWDAITDITVEAGLVAWVHLDRILIDYARNVFEGARKYRFVQARNLQRFRVSRVLGHRQVSSVEVRCWDSENRRRLIARWPLDAEVEIPSRRRSGIVKDDAIVRVVRGFTDLADLYVVAEAIYLELRRQQISGGFETRSLSTLDSDDGEMIDLDSGDAVDVQPAMALSSNGDLYKEPAQEIRARLQRAGVSGKVASALADAASSGKLTTFWTKEAQHTLSNDSGYRLTVMFAEMPTIDAPGASRERMLVQASGPGGNL